MASTSSPAPAVAPKDQMATDAFLSSLAELRSLPHTHVNEKPVGKAEKPNDFGVLVTLNIPERKRKQKRFAVTGPKGDRPNLVAATQEAKRWVNEQLTEAGIEATLPEQPPPQQAAWVFDGDLLDHVDAEEVKSAMQAYKNRMDKEFAALADACDADM